MESLVWAIQANFLIIIIGTLCIYEIYYITFLVFNMYTVLILYIIKFRIAIHNLNKAVKNEE